jgi:hypothetical protein
MVENLIEFPSTLVGSIKTAVSSGGPTEKPANALHLDVSISVELPMLVQRALESLMFYLLKQIPRFVTGNTESYRSSPFPQFTFSLGHRTALSFCAFAFQWRRFCVRKLNATTPHVVPERCLMDSQEVHRPYTIHLEARFVRIIQNFRQKSRKKSRTSQAREMSQMSDISEMSASVARSTPALPKIPVDQCPRHG